MQIPLARNKEFSLYFTSFVWRQLEFAFFGALTSVGALFVFTGGYMSEHIPKKVIDVTGIELTPGEPDACLGNGEQGFECCCDESDYYLLCFPEFDRKNKQENDDDEIYI